MTPSKAWRAAFLLLHVGAGTGAVCAAGFPSEPSPAVVKPAPPPLPQQPDRWLPFRVFNWRDKLEQPVNKLTVDRQGYLWAGTPKGAAVYNGHAWQPVPLPVDPPDTEVTSLLAARDGSLWFGTRRRGLFRRHRGGWQHFQPAEPGAPVPNVHFITESALGGRPVAWAGTSQGLTRCSEAGCRPVPSLWGLSVRALAPTRGEDGRPAFWAATARGLVRLDGIETDRPVLAPLLFDHHNALPSDSVRSLATSTSADGHVSLWVGTDEGGLARLRNGVWTRYDRRAGFPSNAVAALLAGRSEGKPVLWAATFGAGLVRIEEETGEWEVLGRSAGLPSNYLYSLLNAESSGEPTLWIATTGGLARLDRTRWYTIDSRSGLPSDTVAGAGETTFPDGHTTYWVGTTNGTVRLGSNGWELYRPFAEGSSPVLFDLAWTREGKEPVLWLATAQGLFRQTRGAWSLALPPIDAYFLRTVPTPEGAELWASNQVAIRRFSRGTWRVFQPGDDGLPGREITALQSLTTGSRGTLWVGTDAGAAEWTGDRWQPEAAPCLPHPEVLALYPSANSAGDGWLWLGSREGVARMRLAAGRVVAGSCQALTKDHHPRLQDAQIVQILSDARDRLYLFSDQGVIRLTAPDRGSLETTRLEAFDTEDGLPGIHFTRASFVDHQGRIWSGSAAGIALFDPRHELRHSASVPPAPLRIERLLVDGQERPFAAHFELQPRERRLTIEFALLSFEREHAIRYRAQLVGLDAQPGEWSREAHVSHDRLPPGAYTLKVWGRNAEGTVSGPAELSFRVLPPLWRTAWAFVLYAISAIGLGTAVVRLRVRSLAKRAAHLEALVAERTHELAEANRRLELASFTDPLTGLHNRRFLAATIQPDVVQAIRNHRAPPGDPLHRDLIVYLLDLDHFKRLNDRAGHDAGDAVLVEVSRRLRQVIRASDLAVRWGGEEILVISRWTDRAAGNLLAERLLEAIGGRPFRIGVDRTVPVTVSIGWAPFPWSGEDPEAVLFEEVLSLADHALYLAKRNGRNRSVGALPGGCPAEEVVERILREDAPLHALEGMQVELVWSAGPEVAPADRLDTTPRLRSRSQPPAHEAGDAPPPL